MGLSFSDSNIGGKGFMGVLHGKVGGSKKVSERGAETQPSVSHSVQSTAILITLLNY